MYSSCGGVLVVFCTLNAIEERQLAMMLGVIVIVAVLGLCAAVPIENGVEGDPEIECGPTSITINFNTQNEFEGTVYVKVSLSNVHFTPEIRCFIQGLFDQEGCRNEERGRQVAGISLPFDTCNTRRSRSLNPKGVFVSTTVVITFHPQFVTKIDRAYRIQCFYMESDKTVDTNLEVRYGGAKSWKTGERISGYFTAL